MSGRLAMIAALAWLATGAASRAGDVPDVASLERTSRSKVAVGAYRVFLHATDETVTVEKVSWCFVDAGMRRFAGNYRLFATKNGRTVSTLDLGPLEFAEGGLHDGLRPVDLDGHRVLGIAQYSACAGDVLRLYWLDRRGTLSALQVIGPLDGEVATLPTYSMPSPSGARGPIVFCGWSNVGPSECDSYRFDGERLVWTDGWEPSDDDEPSWRRPTTQGRARATATRFLGYVQEHDDRRAAALFDGSPDELHGILASCPSGRLDAIYILDPDTRRRGDRYLLTASEFDGDGELQLEVVARGRSFRIARPSGCPVVSATRP